jgi:hypothetical protein
MDNLSTGGEKRIKAVKNQKSMSVVDVAVARNIR